MSEKVQDSRNTYAENSGEAGSQEKNSDTVNYFEKTENTEDIKSIDDIKDIENIKNINDVKSIEDFKNIDAVKSVENTKNIGKAGRQACLVLTFYKIFIGWK